MVSAEGTTGVNDKHGHLLTCLVVFFFCFVFFLFLLLFFFFFVCLFFFCIIVDAIFIRFIVCVLAGSTVKAYQHRHLQ